MIYLIPQNELNPGDRCPFCNDILEYDPPDEPWRGEGLICPKCFSEYAFYTEECSMIGYNAT